MTKDLKIILEKSQSKVIDDAFISDVTEAFKTEVDRQAKQEVLKEKDILEKSMDDMIKTAIKTIEVDNQENFNKEVNEKVKEEVQNIVESETAKLKEDFKKATLDLEEKSFNTLKQAINQFVTDNKVEMKKVEEVAKAKAITESFNSMVETFGLKINKVDESKELADANKKLDEAIKKISEFEKMESVSKKDMLIKECTKNMSKTDIDRLDKLVEDVEYVDDKQFKQKLDLFISAMGSKRVHIKENKHVDDGEYIPSYKR